MAEHPSQDVTATRGWKRVRKFVSGGAAAALVAGTLVFAGVGVQSALAAGPKPDASFSEPPTFIAGENLTVNLEFGSPTGNTQDGYNLAAGLIVSDKVDLVSAGGMLGSGTEYPAGKAIPGKYGPIPNANYCQNLGLVQAVAPEDTTLCAPAPGTKYIVFENISDLPDGANTSHPVILRPHAGTVFEPGDTIELRMIAFTSDDPAMLPVFPGSTGVSGLTTTHTSQPGTADGEVKVNALRITKSDEEPENELLRGVHDHTTTYTLRVYHTGEGDLSTAKVIDFLPAGLEYLGKGGLDHTTNANGNRPESAPGANNSVEYDGSARLSGTPLPNGGLGRWGASNKEESVTTVKADAALIAAYPDAGLALGGVYTMVTWNLGTLLRSDPQDITQGKPQNLGDEANAVDGIAGYFEIRYRVAVPLFQNTVDFDGAGGQPDGASLNQVANLDNNRGASTRHGVEQDGEANRNAPAQVMTNHAVAQGTYNGAAVAAGAQHSIHAVDVRVLKGVNGVFDGSDTFTQEGTADYELRISTSEYVSATFDFQGTTQRLVDDAGDGLCYALSHPDTVVTKATRGNVSNPGGRVGDGAAPFFALGNPATGSTVPWTADVDSWNEFLSDHGVSAECQWGTSEAQAKAAPLKGATLYSVAFDPTSGHFFMRMDLDPHDALNTVNAAEPNGYHTISYRAIQNSAYVDNAHSGATSSGDTVMNQAEFQGVTHSRSELDDLESANGAKAYGDYDAWDDSTATLQAELSRFDKRVLQRDGMPSSGEVSEAADADWVKEAADPFSIGDQVWYRIRLEPPAGADVRNPELRDFLPAGAFFPTTPVLGTDYLVAPALAADVTKGVGSCGPTNLAEWQTAFASAPLTVTGNRSVLFKLGGTCGLGSDHFLPRGVNVDIFIKATVVNVAAFGAVDFPENQAKYRQNNVEEALHFDRSDAKFEADQMVRLTKGIKSNNYKDPVSGNPAYPDPNGYETNIDGQTAVQGDEVTFRLDVRAPRNATNGYRIIDALPEGITKSDVKTGGYTANLVATIPDLSPGPEGEFVLSETPIDSTKFTHTLLDPSNGSLYTNLGLKPEFEGRTVIVWQVDPSVSVAGSSPENVPTEGDPEKVRGLTLGYTLIVPAGGPGQGVAAQLGQQYVNDASVTDFNFENNSGTNTHVIINGSDSVVKDRTPATNQFGFDDQENDASDPSGINLPLAATSKVLVSTEVGSTTEGAGRDNAKGLTDLSDPQNNGESLVQGEYANFRYSVVIPANTTVADAELYDEGLFRFETNKSKPYEFVSASPSALRPNGHPIPAFAWDEFDFDDTDGKLTFPPTYTNNTAEAQTFAVDIRVWVNDENISSALGLVDSTRLENTARFVWKNPNPVDPQQLESEASASVLYREPSPQISKSATPSTGVKIGDTVTYNLTVNNSMSLPMSYENVVTDTVPAGLQLKVDDSNPTGSFTVAGMPVAYSVEDLPHNGPFTSETVLVTQGVIDGTGGTITWSPKAFAQLGKLPTSVGDGALQLSYVAEIVPTTGGGQVYENVADVTGHTLPGTVGGEDTTGRSGNRFDDAEASITATTAAIGKLVRIKPVAPENPAFTTAVSVPVGQTVQYEVKVTLREKINYYDVKVTDTLPAGIVLQVGSNSPRVFMQTGTVPRVEVTSNWNRTDTAPNHTWNYIATGANGDLLEADAERVLTFVYDALVTDGVPAGSPASALNNSANFTWATTVDGASRTELDPVNATVNMLHPNVVTQKRVKRDDQEDINTSYTAASSGEVNQTFNYRIRVLNSGNTAAYNVAVSDCVPAGIDRSSIDNISREGVLGAVTTACPSGVITWTLAGPVNTGTSNAIYLRYDGKFSDSKTLTAAGKVNTARATSFDSFANGERRTYGPTANSSATVTPKFPNVTLAKSVTNPVGTQGGTGYGVAYVGENFNWTLQVNNATGAGVANQISVTDTLPLNWEYVGNPQISLNGGTTWVALEVSSEDAVGGKVQLVWEESAIRAVGGSPLAAGASFQIKFDAKPTAAALTNPGTGGVRDNIRVKPHTNTLTATAKDLQNNDRNAAGSYVGSQSTADAFINEADLQLTKTTIPTASVKAGSANVDAWNLLVKNNGPDTAVGPITVKDVTGPLPDGISVTSAAGAGWTCAVGARAADGSTQIDCERDTSAESLASGAEFPAIVVKVSVASSQPAATVTNAAIVVPGVTYDPNYVATPNDPGYETQNNRSTASLTTTTEADLRLLKTVSSPVTIPTDGVVVGSQLQWRLSVTNLGPSDSVSTTDTPIRITDTVPAGITNVANPTNSSWVATVTESDGTTGKNFPATAGDVITWKYVGASLGFNVTTEVTLTGTIMTSHVGNIVNSARVHPGVTTDPNYGTPTENNTGSVTTPTNSSTVLDITKTRVVSNGQGGWVQADPETNPTDAFVAGEPVYYRITVVNEGAADAHNVKVVDEAPAGLTFQTGITNPVNLSGTWNPSPVAGTNWHEFALQGGGSLPTTESRAFVVAYDTATTITGPVVNWAEVTADNSPPDRDDDSTGATRIVDLGLVKTHAGTGPFTPGTTVIYTLTVTNHGASATNGVIEIEDLLPAGMSYVPGTTVITVPAGATEPTSTEPVLGDPSERTLSWSLLDVADIFDVNETITVTFGAKIDPALRAGIDLTNRATVEGPNDSTEPEPDPNPNTDTDTVTTTGATASMAIAKQVESAPGVWSETALKLAGTVMRWSVTVTNNGPSAAPVSFSDVLPTGLSFVSVTGNGWDCPVVLDVPTGSCTYTATNGLHPVGAENASTIYIESYINPGLRPTNLPSIPALVNTGTISWSDEVTVGTQTASDTATVTIANDGDLGIVKDVITGAGGEVLAGNAAVATAGETAWYRLQVTNHGPSDASGPVSVTDTLPLGITVPSGASTVNGWSMVAGVVTPGVKQSVTFTLAGGQVAAITGNADRGKAPTIEFKVNIDPSVVHGEALVNTASVSSATVDSNPANNQDDATLSVVRSADLAVKKSHPVADDRDRVFIGEQLDFTIDVTNHGPSVSSGFTVTDTVPVGFDVVEVDGLTDFTALPAQAAGSNWRIDSVTLVADPADVNFGKTLVVATYLDELGVNTGVDNIADSLIISTMPNDAAFSEADDVVNYVEITGANELDPVDPNNEFEDPIKVRPVVTLVLEKTAVGEFKVGKTGLYSITVENLGPHTDRGPITVTDQLPAGLSFNGSPKLPNGATVTHDKGLVTWTLTEPLGVDEKVELLLVVNVLQAAYDQPGHTVINEATVDTESGKSGDRRWQPTDDATVKVKPADPLVNTGGEIAGGMLAAFALLLLFGGGTYIAGRKRQRARHG